jgi:hypothetical protein
MVEPYTAGRIYYRANVVADQTGSYQAKHDTAKAPCPESEDWTCIARSGADGKDGRTFRPRGTCDPAKDYRRLDIAMLNASSFVALCDDPGPCPGENWQLFASVGKRGQKGLKRERGERGPTGRLAIAPRIASSEIDAAYNLNLLYSDGSRDIIPLRPAFERFSSEIRP